MSLIIAEKGAFFYLYCEKSGLKEVVAEVPSADYDAALEFDFPRFTDLEVVKELFLRSGSDRAKRLAKQVAGRAGSHR